MIPILVFAAFAEEPLDLDAAVRRAVEVGVSAEEARIAVETARATLRQKKAAFQPDLGLTLSATGSLGRTFSESLGESVTEPSASTQARVVSTVPIWAGGARRSEARAAGLDLDAADASLDQARQDLALTLADGLLDLAAARGAVELAQARLEAERASEAHIDALVKAGARTRADLLSQVAARAEAESDLLTAKATEAHASLALDELLRLDPAHSPGYTPPTAPPSVPTDTDLLDHALASRPALTAYARAADAREADVRAAKAGYLPSVDLTVGAGTSWQSASPEPVSEQLAGEASAWATVGVDVPILDRGVTRAVATKAELERRSAALDLDAARDGLRVAVAGAVLDRDTARAAADSAAARSAAAEAAAAIVQARYDAGTALVSELLAARADLADAKSAELTARVEVLRAGFRLAWVVGM